MLRLGVGLHDAEKKLLRSLKMDAATHHVVTVTHTSAESEAHEPEECARQALQVGGVLGGAHSHVHAAAASRHRQQESSHRTEQGGDPAPDHRERR